MDSSVVLFNVSRLLFVESLSEQLVIFVAVILWPVFFFTSLFRHTFFRPHTAVVVLLLVLEEILVI